VAVEEVEALARPERRSPASTPDIGMALAVVGILAVMIIPIPRQLMDVLITFNIALSVIVVLVTMYLREPIEFAVFPSLLLVLTLLRLCLNVASTRLILLTANPGSVIRAFGTFVVGGNYVVGVIIFAILVVIQFVVITRGAGRISEVAARFTLDAMPGKQMAIDADLNAGLITEAQARERRRNIERGADFYGAMDGATKFVRGDAIAGLIITAVNIVGGLIIGILIQGRSPAEAVQTYTLLTIGDGLVSQIPALIVATSAGIVVTRTVSEADLGTDIVRQVLAYPRATGIAAAMLFLLALVPGLPTIPFMLIGAVMAVVATSTSRTKLLEEQKRRRADELEKRAAEVPEPEERPIDLLQVDTMEVELGYALIPIADAAQGGDLLNRVSMIRRQMALKMGFMVPPIRIRDNMQLEPNEYVILIREAEVARYTLYVDHFLAMDPGLAKESLPGLATVEPAFGMPAVWVTAEQKDAAEKLGYTVVDPPSVLATHLTEIIKRYAHELLTRQDVSDLIENLKKTTTAVVDELIPTRMSIGEVQKVLQNLLRERVPIRNLERVLEILSDYATITKDLDLVTEYVRQGLARTICSDYVGADGKMHVMTLAPDIEQDIAGSVQEIHGVSRAVLEPGHIQRIISSVARAVEKMVSMGNQPIILCAAQARRFMKRMVEKQLPNVAVLSFNEIDPSVTLESEGTVVLADAS
jgi:flagellar biosynthesis protein FlhA